MKTTEELFLEVEQLYHNSFYYSATSDCIYTKIDRPHYPIRGKWNLCMQHGKIRAYSDDARDPEIFADTIEQLITKIQLIDP